MPNEKLLEKFLDNKCTPEEAGSILEWMSTPAGDEFLNNRIDKDIVTIGEKKAEEMDQAIRSEHMYEQIVSGAGFLKDKSVKATRFISKQWVKIAASILVPLLLTTAILWTISDKDAGRQKWKDIYVPKGKKLQVTLTDGTRIWLNSDSRLKYPAKFTGKSRQVKLLGEAYFVVAKNPEAPFIVHLDKISVKVTGTSFDIKAYSDEQNITATLDEGTIFLQTRKGDAITDYVLEPGQKASYSKVTSKVEFTSFEIGETSLWKENKLSFRDAPLTEVAKVLERWYNVKFVIEDSQQLHYTYTINFEEEPLHKILSALEKITPIRCDYSNGIVTIRKSELQ